MKTKYKDNGQIKVWFVSEILRTYGPENVSEVKSARFY
jgi:hypothetical protein